MFSQWYKMSNEWKVCTPEQAKKFVEIGQDFDYKVDYYWLKVNDEFVLSHRCELGKFKYEEFYPAPDVTELIEILPLGIEANTVSGAEDNWYNRIIKVHGGYLFEYRSYHGDDETLYSVDFHTLAQSLAEMLIWLIKNKHIKLDDIKCNQNKS